MEAASKRIGNVAYMSYAKMDFQHSLNHFLKFSLLILQ